MLCFKRDQVFMPKKNLESRVGINDLMALRQMNQAGERIYFEFFSDFGLPVVNGFFIQVHHLGAVADGFALR